MTCVAGRPGPCTALQTCAANSGSGSDIFTKAAPPGHGTQISSSSSGTGRRPLPLVKRPWTPHRAKRRARVVAVPGAAKRDAPKPWGGRSSSGKDWNIPTQLVSAGWDKVPKDTVLTVYTVRLSTSSRRNSAQVDPLAAANVCLISVDGRAVLQRLSSFNDSEESESHFQHICSVAGQDVGANCHLPLRSKPTWRRSTASVKPRFQEGSVDEFSFLAPELGRLAAVMVGVEAGSWVLDEINVSSSKRHHTDRFVCRSRIGGRDGEAAVYLTPVPAGAVVYGTGEAAVILTKEQARAMRTSTLTNYQDVKQRSLVLTALLALGGTGIWSIVAGPVSAAPFAAGGATGLLYQYLLQAGVDSIGNFAAPPQKKLQILDWGLRPTRLQVFLGNPLLRVLAVTMAALLALWYVQDYEGGAPTRLIGSSAGIDQGAHEGITTAVRTIQPAQVLGAFLGFSMHKLALVSVTLSATHTSRPVEQLEKSN